MTSATVPAMPASSTGVAANTRPMPDCSTWHRRTGSGSTTNTSYPLSASICAARNPTGPAPVTMTRSPGLAAVVINVVIETPINRARTALSGGNSLGTGRVDRASTCWKLWCAPAQKSRSPSDTPLTSAPISAAAKTAA